MTAAETTPVTVVIPSHSERRWSLLVETVDSVLNQRPRPEQVIVVTDHNDALADRVRSELPMVTLLRNESTRGVSGTRNTGARHATTDLIAFVDDDIIVRPGWLAGMIAPFSDPLVVGTGGAIQPVWTTHPRWVPDEFLWAYGASYPGLPTTPAPVRNVWSASMVVRREVFAAVDGFREGFGKVGRRSSPEDTDLCLRMAEAGHGRWIYLPDAVVGHRVEPDRSTVRYFLTRCYHEGRGKVELARLIGDRGTLGTESDYLRRTVPRALRRSVAGAISGRDRNGAARSAAIVAGIAAAGWGAAAETVVAMTTKNFGVTSTKEAR